MTIRRDILVKKIVPNFPFFSMIAKKSRHASLINIEACVRNPFQCREVNFKQVAGCKSETVINALLTEPEVKMTGYWPSSFLPFL